MIKERSILLEKLEGHFNPIAKAQQDAMDMLAEIGLPHRKSESYKYTRITSILDKHIDPDLKGDAMVPDSLRYDTPGNHLVFVNGVYTEKDSTLQDDLQMESGGVTEGMHDPFSLLNTAFDKEEKSIDIGASVAPVFIYHITSHGVANPRVRIRVKDQQEVVVVEKHFSHSSNTFTNAYTEIEVGNNASANYTKIQDYRPEMYSHETVVAHQKRDSRFYINTFSFNGALIRNNLTINLEDEHCEGHMYGLYLLDGKTHVDNNTSVDHKKPNSYSNELYKGILDERSTGVFNGKIYVRQDAQKTNAFQSNNNILLSSDAVVNTKPQLEIWADDVKCSHGCTSGQLDEDAIFYLRARGIPERMARGMILNAFASETLKEVKIDEVKEEIVSLIAKKLS